MKSLLCLLSFVALAGCAYQAKHYDPASTQKLKESDARLQKAVSASKTIAVKLAGDIKAIQDSHAKESTLTLSLQPRLEDLARQAPPALAPLITGLNSDVALLHQEQEDTSSRIAAVVSGQSELGAKLEEANAARNELEGRVNEVVKHDADMVAKANAAEIHAAQNSQEFVSMRAHSWLFKIGCALLDLALVFVAFLWFTGRLATAGAAIASKL